MKNLTTAAVGNAVPHCKIGTQLHCISRMVVKIIKGVNTEIYYIKAMIRVNMYAQQILLLCYCAKYVVFLGLKNLDNTLHKV